MNTVGMHMNLGGCGVGSEYRELAGGPWRGTEETPVVPWTTRGGLWSCGRGVAAVLRGKVAWRRRSARNHIWREAGARTLTAQCHTRVDDSFSFSLEIPRTMCSNVVVLRPNLVRPDRQFEELKMYLFYFREN